MKYNDLDLKNWQELDINTDSLWIISQRDKTGKHNNGIMSVSMTKCTCKHRPIGVAPPIVTGKQIGRAHV